MNKPFLYIITTSYFMCSYVLDGIAHEERVKVIYYNKRKAGILGKMMRVLKAYFTFKRGLWIEYVLDEKVIAEISKIRHEDKVLFFSMENLKDLRIMEKEIFAKDKSLFLWNTVESRYKGLFQTIDFRSFITTTTMKVYTFDPADATRYNLRLRPQVYKYPDRKKISSHNTIYDVFYVGKEKKRADELEKVIQILIQAGVDRLDIHIIKDNDSVRKSVLSGYYDDEMISYQDVLKRIEQSKCILEIVQKGQNGLTLRSLEALFFGKKLITNNPYIKNVDFFSPQNIFVVDSNTTPVAVSNFLHSDIQTISNEVIDKYNISTWIQFFIDKVSN